MVTFVTPLFKSERYLPGYFRHLYQVAEELQRNGVPFEVIIVPWQPNNAEQGYLREVATHPWCKIITENADSLYKALNTGTLHASGEVVGYWYADDWRYAEGVREGVRLIEQGADLVYCPFRIRRYIHVFGRDWLVHIQRIDGRKVPEYNEQTRPLFYHQMHCSPFYLFRKSLYELVGPLDEQFKIVADFDWCVRAARISERLVRASKLGGSFRVDGRGLSSGGKPKHMAENNIVYIRHNQVPYHPLWAVPQGLMDMYDPKSVTFRGQRFVVSSEGLLEGQELQKWLKVTRQAV